jgi:hypothetical protein
MAFLGVYILLIAAVAAATRLHLELPGDLDNRPRLSADPSEDHRSGIAWTRKGGFTSVSALGRGARLAKDDRQQASCGDELFVATVLSAVSFANCFIFQLFHMGPSLLVQCLAVVGWLHSSASTECF